MFLQIFFFHLQKNVSSFLVKNCKNFHVNSKFFFHFLLFIKFLRQFLNIFIKKMSNSSKNPFCILGLKMLASKSPNPHFCWWRARIANPIWKIKSSVLDLKFLALIIAARRKSKLVPLFLFNCPGLSEIFKFRDFCLVLRHNNAGQPRYFNSCELKKKMNNILSYTKLKISKRNINERIQ